MTILLSSKGSAIPPSALTMAGQISTTDNCLATLPLYAAATLSSSVSSATIAEVLNISGSGYILIGGLITATATTVTASKLTIVLDGVAVFNDLAIGSMGATKFNGLIGSFHHDGVNNDTVLAYESIRFNSSIVVSVAGDGTNPVQFAYKLYRTS